MRRQSHPWSAARSAPSDHGQQHLHPEPMPAVRLEEFQASVIVEFFAGQGVADVLADVIVADTPGIRIAVRPLPDLRRRPRAQPRESCAKPDPPARTARSRSAPTRRLGRRS